MGYSLLCCLCKLKVVQRCTQTSRGTELQRELRSFYTIAVIVMSRIQVVSLVPSKLVVQAAFTCLVTHIM